MKGSGASWQEHTAILLVFYNTYVILNAYAREGRKNSKDIFLGKNEFLP